MPVKKLPLNDFDPRLKERLAEDADREGVSINDLAVGILARHFEVSFEPAGGSPRTRSGSKTLDLRMPEALYWKIAVAALGGSKKGVVERALCEHYGLRYGTPPASPSLAR